jgi:branched-chain amino acid transport system permease protein
MKGVGRWPTVVVLAAALALPHFTRGTQTEFAIEVMVTGMFALSLNILIGRLGLISLGHGLFLGVGAYLAGFMLRHLSENLFLLLAAALVLGIVVSALVGAMVLRLGGVGFIMITIAFCQLFYVLILSTQAWSGGINGIPSIPRPTLWPGKDLPGWLSLNSEYTFYYVALVCLVLLVYALKRLDASPLGSVFSGIRQNPARMRALGYPVRRFQLIGFVMAGSLAAVAGALQASLFSLVDPSLLFWTTSGEVILMVILGGVGALYGPLVGAALFLALFHYLGTLTDHWRLVLGIVFVLVVLYAPSGLVPLAANALERWRGKKPGDRRAPAALPEEAP